jgi:hypothetical protein
MLFRKERESISQTTTEPNRTEPKMNSYKQREQQSKPSGQQSKPSGQQSKPSGQQVKPFCKVCYDAGKSEREYTSHFVKNKPGNEGKVVCPYLLSLECNYCKKKEGHTASHCPVLVAKKANQAAESKRPVYDQDGWEVKKGAKQPQKQEPRLQQQAAAPQNRFKSTFDVLSAMIQQEEKQEQEVETKTIKYEAEFPGALSNIKPTNTRKPVLNWSRIDMTAPMKARPQEDKPLVQAKIMPVAEEFENISDDDDRPYEEYEPSSPAEKSWGWSGDWNDCPN